MTKGRLTEEQLNQLRNELHLTSDAGESIFQMNEEESKYSPDDWAWSFLRLSTNYEQSYNAHVDASEDDLSQALILQQPSGIKLDLDGICAEDFGLAAWLPPSTTKLPKLRNEKDSWFFPLRRLVSEDYRRLDVRETPPKLLSRHSPKSITEYPHIAANETLFGYREPLSVPIPIYSNPHHGKPQIKASGMFDVLTFSHVWVAVDCSVPPAGQMASLENLASMVRKALMNQDWRSRRSVRDVDVPIYDVETSGVFSHMKFKHASRPVEKSDEYPYLWRAVMIDSLAPIKAQAKQLLGQLTAIHAELIAAKLAQPPRTQRFKNTISFPQKNGHGASRISRGGSYLKAILTLAKLAKYGYTDPAEVAQIIGLHSPSGHYVGSWAHYFLDRLDEHVQVAIDMADEGYRMLIHEQKPNT